MRGPAFGRQPPAKRNHQKIRAFRVKAAKRRTTNGREANSTSASSARSYGTPVIFSKPSSKPQQILR
jgi:hypothetical protein